MWIGMRPPRDRSRNLIIEPDLLIVVDPGPDGTDLYIDNVYFYDGNAGGGGGTAPTTSAPTPTPKPTPSPVAPPPPPPPSNNTATSAPTSAPTDDDDQQHHHHPSVLRVLGKTIGWLIIIGLSVVGFGAVMSHRYRIYFCLRGLWYALLRTNFVRSILNKIGRGGGSGTNGMDTALNTATSGDSRRA